MQIIANFTRRATQKQAKGDRVVAAYDMRHKLCLKPRLLQKSGAELDLTEQLSHLELSFINILSPELQI